MTSRKTTHTVEAGDSASSIAAHYTNDPSRFPELIEANATKATVGKPGDPDFNFASLILGEELQLPSPWLAAMSDEHEFVRSVPPSRVCTKCGRDVEEHPDFRVAMAAYRSGYAQGLKLNAAAEETDPELVSALDMIAESVLDLEDAHRAAPRAANERRPDFAASAASLRGAEKFLERRFATLRAELRDARTKVIEAEMRAVRAEHARKRGDA